MKKEGFIVVILLFIFNTKCYLQPFTDISVPAGIDTVLGYNFPGFGVSFVDFTGDGYDDITLGTDDGDSILFYKNNGNETFTLLPSKVGHTSISRQILWVDIENDGDLDLFVASGNNNGANGQNKLYENISGVFSDITNTSGLLIQNDNTYGAAFGDIDNDGDLDLFVSNYQVYPSRLYKNNGNKTFTEVTASSGLYLNATPDICPAFLDYNNDNLLDLISIVDKAPTPNILYKNTGNGQFIDVSAATNITLPDDGMSASVADFNNDGNFDIYVSNVKPPNPNIQGNTLYYNAYAFFGQYTFVNSYAINAGVEVDQDCWGTIFIDVNNDKQQDLYVLSENWFAGEKNNLFKNNGDETFSEYYTGGLVGDTMISMAVASGDINNDGKPDMMVTNINFEKARLWKNVDTSSYHHIKVKLNGTTSNKNGIGSRIEVYDEESTQYRFTHCGINYLGQNSLNEHIGMANKTNIDSLIVKWPSGSITKLFNLGVNQKYEITEGQCLNHEYQNGINTAANKYIGPNNGNLLLPTHWSKGHLPTLLEDVEIKNLTSSPMSLTLNANQTLNSRSIKLSGNITFTNLGNITIDKSYGLGLLIDTGSTLINEQNINILFPCGKGIEIKGALYNNGDLFVDKL